jgi:hypothetical protein
MHQGQPKWSDKNQALWKIEDAAKLQLLKAAKLLSATYLILSAFRAGNDLSLGIFGIDASLPAGHFLAIAGLSFHFSSLTVCHLSAAMTLRARHAGKLLAPGFSTGMFNLLQEKEPLALAIPVIPKGFFTDRLRASGFLSLLILFSLSLLCVPYIAYGAYLHTFGIDIVNSDTTQWHEKLASCVAIIAPIFALLQILIYHLPLPFKKDSHFIRWGILHKLPPHASDKAKFTRWAGADSNEQSTRR